MVFKVPSNPSLSMILRESQSAVEKDIRRKHGILRCPGKNIPQQIWAFQKCIYSKPKSRDKEGSDGSYH